MTFIRPTLKTIVGRVRADIDGGLPGADSRLARSLLNILSAAEAGVADGLYGRLDDVAAQILPDTADGEHLDRWATIWGVTRKAAVAAWGKAVLTGLEGAVVPAGAILVRADQAAFRVSAETAIVGGSAEVAVIAVDAGVAGDTDAGVALAFASPQLGVSAAAMVSAGGIAGSADEESDALLLGRLLARIQTPPQGGAASDYRAWALAQPEVTRAWVYPQWMGAGTVGVAVVMDGRADIFPTNEDCAAIAAALDPLRPVTASVIVFAPTPLPIDYRLRIVPDTAATRAAVLAERDDLFAREAAPGGTMRISHIRASISGAAGVTDYDLNVAADVVALPGFMPVPGAVTWL